MRTLQGSASSGNLHILHLVNLILKDFFLCLETLFVSHEDKNGLSALLSASVEAVSFAVLAHWSPLIHTSSKWKLNVLVLVLKNSAEFGHVAERDSSNGWN